MQCVAERTNIVSEQIAGTAVHCRKCLMGNTVRFHYSVYSVGGAIKQCIVAQDCGSHLGQMPVDASVDLVPMLP